MNEVKCRFCETPISESAIDTEKNIAQCTHCSGVFSTKGESSERAEETLPDHMRLEKEKNELYVAEKWFKPINLLYLAGTILLIAGYAAFRVFVLRQFVTASFTRYPFYVSLLQIVFIVGIVGTAYFFIAALLNSTQVFVDRGKLTLRYSPVPWRGGRSFDFDILADIMSTKIGKAYGLLAVLKSGERRGLLKRVETPGQALYIEGHIENMLIRE